MANRTKRKDEYGASPDPQNPDADVYRERKPRAKKDTRRWCKGKEGREHVEVWGFENYFHSWKTPCGWSPVHWPKSKRGTERWRCTHVRKCEVCGKVLKRAWDLPDADCPDYTEDRTVRFSFMTPGG